MRRRVSEFLKAASILKDINKTVYSWKNNCFRSMIEITISGGQLRFLGALLSFHSAGLGLAALYPLHLSCMQEVSFPHNL